MPYQALLGAGGSLKVQRRQTEGTREVWIGIEEDFQILASCDTYPEATVPVQMDAKRPYERPKMSKVTQLQTLVAARELLQECLRVLFCCRQDCALNRDAWPTDSYRSSSMWRGQLEIAVLQTLP